MPVTHRPLRPSGLTGTGLIYIVGTLVLDQPCGRAERTGVDDAVEGRERPPALSQRVLSTNRFPRSSVAQTATETQTSRTWLKAPGSPTSSSRQIVSMHRGNRQNSHRSSAITTAAAGGDCTVVPTSRRRRHRLLIFESSRHSPRDSAPRSSLRCLADQKSATRDRPDPAGTTPGNSIVTSPD
jgi:hypothetical protein